MAERPPAMADQQTVPTPTRKNELAKRIISAAVLAPLTLGAVYLGGYAYLALVLIIGVLLAWEWTHIVIDKTPYRYALVLALFVVLFALLAHFGNLQGVAMAAPLFFLVAFLNAPRKAQVWRLRPVLHWFCGHLWQAGQHFLQPLVPLFRNGHDRA